jgi:hypothetical protein
LGGLLEDRAHTLQGDLEELAVVPVSLASEALVDVQLGLVTILDVDVVHQFEALGQAGRRSELLGALTRKAGRLPE